MAFQMVAKSFRILMPLLLATLAVGGVRTIYENNSQDIILQPLNLDPAHRGERRVGELIFMQAWEMTSRNENFGGISALAALPGGQFIAVGDAGTVTGFGLTNDGVIERSFIAPLPGSQGRGKSYKDRDSEGIAYDPASGQFWVSYEVRHVIRRFASPFTRSTGSLVLKARTKWADNKGVEALVRLSDGRFVAIAENIEDGVHEGFLFSDDPVARGTTISRFSFRPPEGYRVTDGVMLPDGRLLILNRSVGFPQGFTAKLAIVEAIDIGKAAMKGRVIATLAPPLLVDNMEGVAITRQGNDTIIWLISDNNFNIWQRTLLMKFRLAERNQKKPEASPASGF